MSAPRPPIPVQVVTGPLGAGKTTVIARLFAGKPPQARWVALLNEFTDAGIDALTVAGAARGVYDVRLVPGGCLCCTGEEDFRRQLGELVARGDVERIVVEPSGLGHPAGIVEELLAHEAAGGLVLTSVVALLDVEALEGIEAGRRDLAFDQAEIADALALARADASQPGALDLLRRVAAGFYPPKRWLGPVEQGAIDEAAWRAATPAADASPSRAAPRARPESHGGAHTHAHVHEETGSRVRSDGPAEAAPAASERAFERFEHLGREGARWRLPRALEFDEDRLLGRLRALAARGGVARFKGVFRVGEDRWVLLQLAGGRWSIADSGWRRDQRLEVLCEPGARLDAVDWDRALAAAQRSPP